MKRMKLKYIIFGIILGVSMIPSHILYGQSKGEKDDILITIDGNDITSAEFLAIYHKNNPKETKVNKKKLKDYMERYIDFKLKVYDAEAQGYDTEDDFKNELDRYLDHLSLSYLVKQDYTEKLIAEAYERMQYEIQARHIMIKIPKDPSSQDTLNAWNKMDVIREKALRPNMVFADLAKEKSDDPSAKENGGELGYFSALQMVYPFESKAYNTEVGEISTIVRTDYGYHIIEVENKIPARGEVKMAHIMIAIERNPSVESVEEAHKKIDKIYTKLQEGEEFSVLAIGYSEDRTSAQKGGDLGWLNAGSMTPNFETQAYALTENGVYSAPFQTLYGWHIIMREDIKHIGTFQEEYSNIAQKVRKDSRNLDAQHALVIELMKSYKVKINTDAKEDVLTELEESDFFSHWTMRGINIKKLNSEIITINDKIYGKKKKNITQVEFVNFLIDRKDNKPSRNISSYIEIEFNAFLENEIIGYEKTILTYKYPEYNVLESEYHDGILLFEIMQNKVWDNAINDSIGLLQFYAMNKADFVSKEKIDVKIYISDDKVQADVIFDGLLNKESSISELNALDELSLTNREGIYARGDEVVLENISWENGVYIQEMDGNYAVIHVREVIAPAEFAFDDIKGRLTSAYQDELDQQWIQELRSEYSYSVNTDVLNKITK